MNRVIIIVLKEGKKRENDRTYCTLKMCVLKY